MPEPRGFEDRSLFRRVRKDIVGVLEPVAREREEGLPEGHLSTLTRLNIEALRRVGGKTSPNAKGSLGIRVYDEPIRYNITIVDQAKCVVQPYLPDARGVESPTLVIEKDETMPGLYTTFAQVFESMWDRAREVA